MDELANEKRSKAVEKNRLDSDIRRVQTQISKNEGTINAFNNLSERIEREGNSLGLMGRTIASQTGGEDAYNARADAHNRNLEILREKRFDAETAQWELDGLSNELDGLIESLTILGEEFDRIEDELSLKEDELASKREAKEELLKLKTNFPQLELSAQSLIPDKDQIKSKIEVFQTNIQNTHKEIETAKHQLLNNDEKKELETAVAFGETLEKKYNLYWYLAYGLTVIVFLGLFSLLGFIVASLVSVGIVFSARIIRGQVSSSVEQAKTVLANTSDEGAGIDDGATNGEEEIEHS